MTIWSYSGDSGIDRFSACPDNLAVKAEGRMQKSAGRFVPVRGLSAFVICKDEAAYIEDCLRSLDVCSEIIVVDSGSEDATPEIVRRLADEGLPIRFIHNEWLGYARQKQFALEQCTGEWCINVDADERLDEELKQALPELIAASPNVAAWRIRRRPFLIGYGYTPPHVFERANLRLVRRGKGAYDLDQRVHEGIVATGCVKIATTGSLLHDRPLTIDEQVVKNSTYSNLKAEQVLETGAQRSRLRMVFTPLCYFLRLYFLRRFFLCGWPGFIHAATGAVYSFTTEAKIYQQSVAAGSQS